MIDCAAFLYRSNDINVARAAPEIVITTLPMRRRSPAVEHRTSGPRPTHSSATLAVHREREEGEEDGQEELDVYALHHVYSTYPSALVVLVTPPGVPSLFTTAARLPGSAASTLAPSQPLSDVAFFTREEVCRCTVQVAVSDAARLRRGGSSRGAHERDGGGPAVERASEDGSCSTFSEDPHVVPGTVRFFVAPAHAEHLLRSHPWLAPLCRLERGAITSAHSHAAEERVALCTPQRIALHLLSLPSEPGAMMTAKGAAGSSAVTPSAYRFTCERALYARLVRELQWIAMSSPAVRDALAGARPLTSLLLDERSPTGGPRAPRAYHTQVLCTSASTAAAVRGTSFERELLSIFLQTLLQSCGVGRASQGLVTSNTEDRDADAHTLLLHLSESETVEGSADSDRCARVVRLCGALRDVVRSAADTLVLLPSGPPLHRPSSDKDREEVEVHELFDLWVACGEELRQLQREHHCQTLQSCHERSVRAVTIPHLCVLLLLTAREVAFVRRIHVCDFLRGNAAFAGVDVFIAVVPSDASAEAYEAAVVAAEDTELRALAALCGGRTLAMAFDTAGGVPQASRTCGVADGGDVPPAQGNSESPPREGWVHDGPRTWATMAVEEAEHFPTTADPITLAEGNPSVYPGATVLTGVVGCAGPSAVDEGPSPVRRTSTCPGSENGSSPVSSRMDIDVRADAVGAAGVVRWELTTEEELSSTMDGSHPSWGTTVAGIDDAQAGAGTPGEQSTYTAPVGRSASPPLWPPTEGLCCARATASDSSADDVDPLRWCTFGAPNPPHLVTCLAALFACALPAVCHSRGGLDLTALSEDAVQVNYTLDAPLSPETAVAGDEMWLAVLLEVDPVSAYLAFKAVAQLEQPLPSARRWTAAFSALSPMSAYACVVFLLEGAPAGLSQSGGDADSACIHPQDVLHMDGVAFCMPAARVRGLACESVAADDGGALRIQWDGSHAVKLLVQELSSRVDSTGEGEKLTPKDARAQVAPGELRIVRRSPVTLRGLSHLTVYAIQAVTMVGKGTQTGRAQHHAHVRALPTLRGHPPSAVFGLTLPSISAAKLTSALVSLHQTPTDGGVEAGEEPRLPTAVARFGYPVYTVTAAVPVALDHAMEGARRVVRANVLPVLSTRVVGSDRGLVESAGEVCVTFRPHTPLHLSLRLHIVVGMEVFDPLTDAHEVLPLYPLHAADRPVLPPSRSTIVHEQQTPPLLTLPAGPFHVVSRDIRVETDASARLARLQWWGTSPSYELTLHAVAGADMNAGGPAPAEVRMVVGTARQAKVRDGSRPGGSDLYDANATLGSLQPAVRYVVSVACSGVDTAEDVLGLREGLHHLARATVTFTTRPLPPRHVPVPPFTTTVMKARVGEGGAAARVSAVFDLHSGQLHLRLWADEPSGVHGRRDARGGSPTPARARRVVAVVDPPHTIVELPRSDYEHVDRIISCRASSASSMKAVGAPDSAIVLSMHEEEEVVAHTMSATTSAASAHAQDTLPSRTTVKSQPITLFAVSDITCRVREDDGALVLAWCCAAVPDSVTLNGIPFPLAPNSTNHLVAPADRLSSLAGCGGHAGPDPSEEVATTVPAAGQTPWCRPLTLAWQGSRLIPALAPVVLLPPPPAVGQVPHRLNMYGTRGELWLSAGALWRPYLTDVVYTPSRPGRGPAASAGGTLPPLELTVTVALPAGEVLVRAAIPPPPPEYYMGGCAAELTMQGESISHSWECIAFPLPIRRPVEAAVMVTVTAECVALAEAGSTHSEEGLALAPEVVAGRPWYGIPAPTSAPHRLPVPPVVPVHGLQLRRLTPHTATLEWGIAAKHDPVWWPTPADPQRQLQKSWRPQRSAGPWRDAVHSESDAGESGLMGHDPEAQETAYEFVVVAATEVISAAAEEVAATPTENRASKPRKRCGSSADSIAAASDSARREEILCELQRFHARQHTPGGCHTRALAARSLAGLYYAREASHTLTIQDLEAGVPYTVLVRARVGRQSPQWHRRSDIEVRLFSEVVFVTPLDATDPPLLTAVSDSLCIDEAAMRGTARLPLFSPRSFHVYHCAAYGQTVGVLTPISGSRSGVAVDGDLGEQQRTFTAPVAIAVTVSGAVAVALVSATGSVEQEWTAALPVTPLSLAQERRRSLAWSLTHCVVHGHLRDVWSHLALAVVTESVVDGEGEVMGVRARSGRTGSCTSATVPVTTTAVVGCATGLLTAPVEPVPLPRARVDVVGDVRVVGEVRPSGCTLQWRGSAHTYRVAYVTLRFPASRRPVAPGTDAAMRSGALVVRDVTVTDPTKPPALEVTLPSRQNAPGTFHVLVALVRSAGAASNIVCVALVLPPSLVETGRTAGPHGEGRRVRGKVCVLHLSAERVTLMVPPPYGYTRDGTRIAPTVKDDTTPIATLRWRATAEVPGSGVRAKWGLHSTRVVRWAGGAEDEDGGDARSRVFDVFPPAPRPPSGSAATTRAGGGGTVAQTVVLLEAHVTVVDPASADWAQVLESLLRASHEDTMRSGPARSPPLRWLSTDATAQRQVVVPRPSSLRHLRIHRIMGEVDSDVSLDVLADIAACDATAPVPLVRLTECAANELPASLSSGVARWSDLAEPNDVSKRPACSIIVSWLSNDTAFAVDLMNHHDSLERDEDALQTAIDTLPAPVTDDEPVYKLHCLHAARTRARSDGESLAQPQRATGRRLYLTCAPSDTDGGPRTMPGTHTHTHMASDERRYYALLSGLAPEHLYRLRIRGAFSGDTALRAQLVIPPSPHTLSLHITRRPAQTITVVAYREGRPLHVEAADVLARAAVPASPRPMLFPGVVYESTAAVVLLAKGVAGGRVRRRFRHPLRLDGHAHGDSHNPAPSPTAPSLTFTLAPDSTAGPAIATGVGQVLVSTEQQLTLDCTDARLARRFLCVPLWGPLLLPDPAGLNVVSVSGTASGRTDGDGRGGGGVDGVPVEQTRVVVHVPRCRIPRVPVVDAVRLQTRTPHALTLAWRYADPRRPSEAVPLARTTGGASVGRPDVTFHMRAEAVRDGAEPVGVCRVSVMSGAETPTATLTGLRPATLYRIGLEAELSGERGSVPPRRRLPTAGGRVRARDGRGGEGGAPSNGRATAGRAVAMEALDHGGTCRAAAESLAKLTRGRSGGEGSACRAPQQRHGSRDALVTLTDELVDGGFVNTHSGGPRACVYVLTAPAPSVMGSPSVELTADGGAAVVRMSAEVSVTTHREERTPGTRGLALGEPARVRHVVLQYTALCVFLSTCTVYIPPAVYDLVHARRAGHGENLAADPAELWHTSLVHAVGTAGESRPSLRQQGPSGDLLSLLSGVGVEGVRVLPMPLMHTDGTVERAARPAAPPLMSECHVPLLEEDARASQRLHRFALLRCAHVLVKSPSNGVAGELGILPVTGGTLAITLGAELHPQRHPGRLLCDDLQLLSRSAMGLTLTWRVLAPLCPPDTVFLIRSRVHPRGVAPTVDEDSPAAPTLARVPLYRASAHRREGARVEEAPCVDPVVTLALPLTECEEVSPVEFAAPPSTRVRATLWKALHGLDPRDGHTLAVAVRAPGGFCDAMATTPLPLRAIPIPEPVPRVELDTVTDTSFTVTWPAGAATAECAPPDSPISFVVSCRVAGVDLADEVVRRMDVHARSTTFSGLRPCTAYTVVVVSENVFGEALRHDAPILTVTTTQSTEDTGGEPVHSAR